MSQSRIDNRRDIRSLAIAAGVVLVMAVVSGGVITFAYYRLLRPQVEAPAEGANWRGADVGHLTQPPPMTHGYVGSAACAECHGDISEEYQSHSMSHSLAEVTHATMVEDYENATFSPPGPRVYQVERRGDQVLHHEKLHDRDGELLYDQAVPVQYEIGSGQRGRAYVIDRGGVLFQSPIGWYSHAGKWDLSPGYDPRSHKRFERRIDDGCLYCHAGRVSTDQAGSDRYRTPPFVEAAIGCERCHGPGEEHVAKQMATPTSGEPDPTIVNPARLDPVRRDSVCYQCHLQGESVIPRYGRSFFDFRPGDRIEDVWVVFVAGDRVDEEGHTRAVSQVEQMRASRCFTASEGRMGCISCHDPHSKPTAERRVKYFQQRCLSCHEERGCSLPQAEREEPPASGSCIVCHMPRLPMDVPHTAQTDHRILRRPDLGPHPSASTAATEELEVFDDGAESRLPSAEIRRARGLAMTGRAARGRDEQYADQIEALLVPASVANRGDTAAVREAVGDDIPVLNTLGAVYLMQQRWDAAAACWQRVLQIDPMDELALQRLMLYFHDRNELELAMTYSERLLMINPYLTEIHGRRAHMLGQIGDFEAGVESALRAMEYDPTSIKTREWLVEIYPLVGKPEEAEKQREFIERVRAAVTPP